MGAPLIRFRPPMLPSRATSEEVPPVEPKRVLSADEIWLSDREFWLRPLEEREGAFATLREERPISFHEELEIPILPKGPGYWSAVKHADVLEVSRNPELFCSGRGSNIVDLPQPFIEFFGSMINMDDPRHGRLRRIVSRGFTPRALKRYEDDVQRVAREIVDARDREGRVRLRHRDRRGAAAAHHLRHDGHPREPAPVRLRPHQRDPRRRRSRVHARPRPREDHPGAAAGGRGARDAGAGPRPPPRRPPDRRPDLRARERRDRRRAPDRAGARLVLRAAGGGRQRDHAQRDQPRHEGAQRPSRAARDLARRTSRAWRRRRSRRSCAGPRR